MITDSCNKVFFATEAAALFYIDKLNRTSARERKPTNAYLCPKCLMWHLTSKHRSEQDIEKEAKEKYKTVIKTLEANNLKLKEKVKAQEAIIHEMNYKLANK